ncbi:MAG: GNAT family N-acetyltransferase [Acidobacteria bacterium]|nr:GNAT family N-acetyltransferase [Acidobacteriota bacterium]
MPVTLRPVAESDEDFLYQVYASTRRAEVSAWGWNEQQQDAFLRMQFTMQRRSFEMQHPDAAHDIILLDEEPIGRLLVERSDGEIQLTDISLLASHRGRGIGSQVIKKLLEEADRTRSKVKLQVLKVNPAARLYERLGFIRTGERGLYFQMERPAA